MEDQVTGLPSKGLSAAIIGASSEGDSRIKQGCYSFVYGSPEAIVGSDEWMKAFQSDVFRRNIAIIVVDEVHSLPF